MLLSLTHNLIVMLLNIYPLWLSGQELIIVLIVVLLLFGGKKIPELMRGLGRGVREFNDAKSNVKKEIEESTNEINKP